MHFRAGSHRMEIGVLGFEPRTSWIQTRNAIRLRYTPEVGRERSTGLRCERRGVECGWRDRSRVWRRWRRGGGQRARREPGEGSRRHRGARGGRGLRGVARRPGGQKKPPRARGWRGGRSDVPCWMAASEGTPPLTGTTAPLRLRGMLSWMCAEHDGLLEDLRVTMTGAS